MVTNINDTWWPTLTNYLAISWKHEIITWFDFTFNFLYHVCSIVNCIGHRHDLLYATTRRQFYRKQGEVFELEQREKNYMVKRFHYYVTPWRILWKLSCKRNATWWKFHARNHFFKWQWTKIIIQRRNYWSLQMILKELCFLWRTMGDKQAISICFWLMQNVLIDNWSIVSCDIYVKEKRTTYI